MLGPPPKILQRPDVIFEYGGIGFRKLEKSDLGQLLALKTESWPTTHHTAFLNEDDQGKWFESLDSDVINPKNLVLVAHAIDSRPMGDPACRMGIFKIFDIDWISRRCDCAWDVFKGSRGVGWGKKLVIAGTAFCFNMLNLHRLSCEILDINEASKKCAAAAGWRIEGRKEECIYKMGIGYVDSLVYGNLRLHWQGHKSSKITTSGDTKNAPMNTEPSKNDGTTSNLGE